jgi:hypothetical protein
MMKRTTDVKKRETHLRTTIPLERRILTMRGEKVILDADLAELYGVPTKALNQAVKRNASRFPELFLFRLTQQEVDELNRSQIVTGSQRHRDPRFPPYAFTEHGALMAANVLNSARAVQMSIFLVEAFVKMRRMLTDTRELAQKLSALEQEIKGRLDIHEAAIVEVLQRIMRILDPPAEPPSPEPAKKEIGFHIREQPVPYRVRRKFSRL